MENITNNNYRPKMKNQNFIILRQNDISQNNKIIQNQNQSQNNKIYGDTSLKENLNYKKIISLSLNRNLKNDDIKGRCKKLKLIEQEQQILKVLRQEENDENKMVVVDIPADEIEMLSSPLQKRRSNAINSISKLNYFISDSINNRGQKIKNKYYLSSNKKNNSNIQDEWEQEKQNMDNLIQQTQNEYLGIQQLDEETNNLNNHLHFNQSLIGSPKNISNQKIRAVSQNESIFPKSINYSNRVLKINKNEFSKLLKPNKIERKSVQIENNNNNNINKLQIQDNKIKNQDILNEQIQSKNQQLDQQNQYNAHNFPNLAQQHNQLNILSPKQQSNGLQSNNVNNIVSKEQNNINLNDQNKTETKNESIKDQNIIGQNQLQEQQVDKKIIDTFLEEQNIDFVNQQAKSPKQICLSDPTIINNYNQENISNQKRLNTNKNKNLDNLKSCYQYYGQQQQNESKNISNYRSILKEQKNMQSVQQSIINRIHHLEKEETKNMMKIEETRKRVFQIVQEKINRQGKENSNLKGDLQKIEWDSNVQIQQKKIRSQSVAEPRILFGDQNKLQKITILEKKKERVSQMKAQTKQMIEQSIQKEQNEFQQKELKCQNIRISLQKARENINRAIQQKNNNSVFELNQSIKMEAQKNEMINMSIQQLEEIEYNLIEKLSHTQMKQKRVLNELQDALQMNPQQFCNIYLHQIANDQQIMLTEQSNKIYNLFNRKNPIY